jgi:phenylacetate-CoA ligase
VVEPAGGKPVSPGASGELILTTLGRIGSPLIRYRTGDLVKPAPSAGEPCACGRFELALEGGIIGRTDDMVIVRGVNVYPSAVEEIVRAAGAVAEYQVEISATNALPELSLQIEPRADCKDVAELVRRLEKDFESTLALRVPVTVLPLGTLPRFEMKAKRWVRK